MRFKRGRKAPFSLQQDDLAKDDHRFEQDPYYDADRIVTCEPIRDRWGMFVVELNETLA